MRNWQAARAKVEREGGCRICGEPLGTQAAHIVPRSLGGQMSEDSIVPLCPAHHSAFDAHDLDLISHLSRDEQAEAVRVLGLERARVRLLPSEYPDLRLRDAARDMRGAA